VLNALTVKFAAELESQGVLVNAVCSGLTATYPGAQAMGARPIPEGAARIIWAATLSDDGLTAGFFRDGQLLPWQASNESLEYVKSSEYWRILHHAAVAPPDFSFENHCWVVDKSLDSEEKTWLIWHICLRGAGKF
jgi:hypothetical protein